VSQDEGAAIVSDPRSSDDRLREAFQSLGEASHENLSAADLVQVWRAVSGELPAHERRELVDRTASDPALADAWRIALELWRETAQPLPAATGRRRFWMQSGLAAAAVLLIGIAIGIVFRLSPAPDETFRDPDHYVIESLVPSDAALPRDAFRLRWKPGPQDSRYRVRATTEDLQVLATVSDLTVPELVLDRERLANLATGARVLWQVDVTLPGGRTIASPTYSVRVQ
jgi:hypothetical protein